MEQGDLRQQRRKDSRFESPLDPTLLGFRALVSLGGEQEGGCPRALKPGLSSDHRQLPISLEGDMFWLPG